jgi:hypothetical protein
MNDQMDSAQHLLEHVSNFAIEQFDQSGEFHTMWFIVCGSGQLLPIVSPLLGHLHKDALAEVIKDVLKEQNAIRFAMATEAWMVDSKDDPTLDKDVVPSEHAKRREVVMITVEDHNGEHIFAVHDIVREDGEKPKLAPLEVMKMDTTEGRFSAMFGERVVH